MSESIHDNKIRIPINKQAALIVRRASELHLHTPPPEKSKALTREQIREIELKNLRKQIEEKEKEAEQRRNRRAALRVQVQKPKPKPTWRHMWAQKYLKRMHKSRGLPPPTMDQIQAFRKSQPNFGKPL